VSPDCSPPAALVMEVVRRIPHLLAEITSVADASKLY